MLNNRSFSVKFKNMFFAENKKIRLVHLVHVLYQPNIKFLSYENSDLISSEK